MRLKSVTGKGFRRFTDITVQGIPESARLIMLAGPHGSGKSSFLDALHIWGTEHHYGGRGSDPAYYDKVASAASPPDGLGVAVDPHSPYPDHDRQQGKFIYVRSAFRNDPDFETRRVERLGDRLNEYRISRMIDNDAAVSRNYTRIAGKVFDIFTLQSPMMTDQFVESLIGPIRTALVRLFAELRLDGLGDPLESGTFRFSKGTSSGFAYKNLSGGEKSAFDLILDLALAAERYDNTIFCIDEPEAHTNSHIQADLLSVLYGFIPHNCQLMVATHSVGMMRRARDIEAEEPGSVVFLDFGGRDFDQPQVIEPVQPDRAFWERTYEVALADLAALVAPERVVICEGEHRTRGGAAQSHSHDARCYGKMFAAEFPDTTFVPGGNAGEVAGDGRAIASALGIVVRGTDVIRLIDRDARSDEEIEDLRKSGVRVLSRRNLESYLFNDEVLRALADSVGEEDQTQALLENVHSIRAARLGDAPDDLKPASGEIYNACKQLLSLSNPGNTAKVFMRDTLAPLVEPRMRVYKELQRDIFGATEESDARP